MFACVALTYLTLLLQRFRVKLVDYTTGLLAPPSNTRVDDANDESGQNQRCSIHTLFYEPLQTLPSTAKASHTQNKWQ